MNLFFISDHLLTIVYDKNPHLDFVTPDDVLQVVVLQEPPGHIRTKLTSHSSLAGTATIHGLGVRPEQLTHDTLLWRLSVPVCSLDISQLDIILAEQSSMHH